MKKLIFIFVAMFAVSFVSCGEKKAAQEATETVDTLAIDSVTVDADTVVVEADTVSVVAD